MKILIIFIGVLCYLNINAQIPINFNTPDVMIESSNTPNSKFLNLGENSIYINPLNPLHIVNANNANYNDGVNNLRGEAIFYSDDGGSTWKATSAPPDFIGLPNTYDPSIVLDHNDRKYFNYLSTISDNNIIYSDDNFVTNSNPFILSNASDKNYLDIDDRPIADHLELFAGWDINITQIFARTGNVVSSQLINWDPPTDLTDPLLFNPPNSPNLKYNHGINIAVAPNGDAYACWSIYDGLNSHASIEKFIGFAKWSHLSQTWISSGYIPNLEINGIRNNPKIGSLSTLSSAAVASWITMSINQQNGDIYICWSNVGDPCTSITNPNCNCNTSSTCNANVYFIKSSDGGNSWSSPLVVNSSILPLHWDSWLACDPYTGYLGIIYYGQDVSQNTNTYLSLSIDGGSTWTEQQISDNQFQTLTANNFVTTDYINLKICNGLVVPVWTGRDPILTHNSRETAFCQPFIMDVSQNLSLCDPVTSYYEIDKASQNIELSNQGCGYQIQSGSYINMYASNSIKMNPGFQAIAGSKFHAHIEPNPGPFNANERRSQNYLNSQVQPKESFNVISYPNPFHEFSNISVTSNTDNIITIDLYDGFGRLVKHLLKNVNIQNGTTNYYLYRSELNLVQGVYTCIITSLYQKKSIKLICID